jgi:hypothetical protein
MYGKAPDQNASGLGTQMEWWALAYQPRGPGFNPQYHKTNKKMPLVFILKNTVLGTQTNALLPSCDLS